MAKKKEEQIEVWENVDFSQVEYFLRGQQPHTYIISLLQEDRYLLSYVRFKDLAVAHVHFEKNASGIWKTGGSESFVSIHQVIERIIQPEENQPKPQSYKRKIQNNFSFKI